MFDSIKTSFKEFVVAAKRLPYRFLSYLMETDSLYNLINEQKNTINGLTGRVIHLEQENLVLLNELQDVRNEIQKAFDELTENYEEFEVDVSNIVGLEKEIDYQVETWLENNLSDYVNDKVNDYNFEDTIKNVTEELILNHDLVDMEVLSNHVVELLVDKLKS